jgi:hypothetical protein
MGRTRNFLLGVDEEKDSPAAVLFPGTDAFSEPDASVPYQAAATP